MQISPVNNILNFKNTVCINRANGIKIIQEKSKRGQKSGKTQTTIYNKKGLLFACNELAQKIIKELLNNGKISKQEAQVRLSNLAEERIEINALPGSRIFCQYSE